MKKYLYTNLNLRLFDANPNTQTTSSAGLTAGMHTYYEDRLIDYAEPMLVHDQFGDKYPIPQHNGKTIEFRKYSPLSKALTALTEGVTPDGGNINMSTLTATISQYGYYITISDILELSHVDPQIEQATKLLGSQAGRTLDTITRDVIAGGTNVMYAPTVANNVETEVLSRADLNSTALLDVKRIFKAAAKLNSMNARPIDDSFVAIIHPNVACDLMTSDKWLDVHKYAQPENIYKGEIGKLGGVRFVETTEAKVIAPDKIFKCLSVNRTTLQANAEANATTIKPNCTISADEVTAFASAESADKYIYLNGTKIAVTAVTAGAPGTAAFTVGALAAAHTAGETVCGLGAAKGGESVYCTMFIAQNAYGVTELSGGGLQHIVKQMGSAGSGDPLNQRATTGWKATKVAERLVEEYMVRLEHCCETALNADTN